MESEERVLNRSRSHSEKMRVFVLKQLATELRRTLKKEPADGIEDRKDVLNTYRHVVHHRLEELTNMFVLYVVKELAKVQGASWKNALVNGVIESVAEDYLPSESTADGSTSAAENQTTVSMEEGR